MKVLEYLNTIKSLGNYVGGSLYLKSSNNSGCVYKYLIKNVDGSASRKEIFIELNEEENELELLDKTAINNIEVYPAK